MLTYYRIDMIDNILKIIPYKDPAQKPPFKYPLPKELNLKSTFSAIMIGNSGSGKSTVIRNLIRILAPNIKKPNRFLFQSTVESDNTLATKFNPENIFTKYDDEFFNGLMTLIREENKERISDKKRPQEYLLVFDDQIGLISRHSDLYSEFTRNRHAHANIILSTQQYKALPPLARFNSTIFIIFGSINVAELSNIERELNKKYPPQLFREKFLEKIHGHNFLFINNRGEGEYLINFTTPFITDEELIAFKNK